MVSDRGPRGYRHAILAALGWLIVSAAPHPNPTTKRDQPAAEHAIANSLDNIAATYREEAERAKRTERDEEHCGPHQYHRNSDLCAQWKAADAAADAAWWAQFSSWVGGLSLAAVAFALYLTVQSNRIARDAQRPWLTLSLEIKRVKIDDNVHSFDFELILKNVGDAPVVRGHVEAEFFDPFERGTGPNDWIAEQSIRYRSTKLLTGFTVAPQEKLRWDIAAHWIDEKGRDKPIRMIVVSACYQSSHDNQNVRQATRGFLITYVDMLLLPRNPPGVAGTHHDLPGEIFDVKPANNVNIST